MNLKIKPLPGEGLIHNRPHYCRFECQGKVFECTSCGRLVGWKFVGRYNEAMRRHRKRQAAKKKGGGDVREN